MDLKNKKISVLRKIIVTSQKIKDIIDYEIDYPNLKFYEIKLEYLQKKYVAMLGIYPYNSDI